MYTMKRLSHRLFHDLLLAPVFRQCLYYRDTCCNEAQPLFKDGRATHYTGGVASPVAAAAQ